MLPAAMLRVLSRVVSSSSRLASRAAPPRIHSTLPAAGASAGTPGIRGLTRSMWLLCSSGRGPLSSSRRLNGLSCSCGALHTEGDKAFAEFLTDEIQEEKKIQKSSNLPKMSGGWEVGLNGTEAKLIRKVDGEKVTVSFNINNSIPPTMEEEPQEGQKGAENEPEIVSTPNFVVEVTKLSNNQSLVFDCHYPEDEVGRDDEDDSDIFAIREVSFQPTAEEDWKDTSFTLNTDSLDWALYDHLMDFLADRGIDNTFADELVELSTAVEHQEYIKFLENLSSFIKC
ncbi:complement component 1 Q subcomponent-binding protein, mitochondrial isoform X2 [Scyliorhinus canicula]|uniref:complement component 1 Q subcomponent-binding protein, mitochondrial isoform X2 n=1 Tax=Scyliorhinus canicula TaxID=7830 RepID=UPI0018F33225|nr:complement component 1 Q subcomponent-binding protein, mitochondrial isoform X2 [Scyliorhinus canicula]